MTYSTLADIRERNYRYLRRARYPHWAPSNAGQAAYDRADLLKMLSRERVLSGSAFPFDVASVLEKLASAAEHLLDDHSCDGHGHEQVRIAVTTARRFIRARRVPIDPDANRENRARDPFA